MEMKCLNKEKTIVPEEAIVQDVQDARSFTDNRCSWTLTMCYVQNSN